MNSRVSLPLAGPNNYFPSGSSSFACPNVLSTSISFCACNTLWKKRWQMVVGYVRGSHCTHFGDGMQHPSGPRWPCDKAHTNLIIVYKARCHFGFSEYFSIFWMYLQGADSFRRSRSCTKLQCTLPTPELKERVSIICIFTIYKGPHFSKHGLPFLVWAPIPIHTCATWPHTHWCLDVILREKWNLVEL